MYTYLLVVGACVAFADGFGIGANDVANSFATSVGSRSLTLKQACSIAVFSEFLGAFLLGSHTAETIRNNIIKPEKFVERPEVLMLVMVCALVGSATWVIFATSKGWPVSTTHSIVGAIIGAGLASYGADVVVWNYKGVSKIVTSWFLSPVIAGIVASFIFLLTKYFVLIHGDNSFRRGLVAVPIYFAFTIAINLLYLIFKGSPQLKLDKVKPVIIAPVVVGATLLISLFSFLFYAEWLKRKIEGGETGLRWYHVFVIRFIGARYDNSKKDTEKAATTNNQADKTAPEVVGDSQPPQQQQQQKEPPRGFIGHVKKFAFHGLNKEIADYKAHENDHHDHAVRYDDNTETLYSFLQVLTATCASFAHGSNDVANAVGPLSVIYYIHENGKVDDKKTPVPLWVLALGGIAIDCGLLLYGYHVMRSLGNRITYHSPSRGFSMELGASLTVLTASKLGLPISTTHCITGATAGVGLCNGTAKAINLKLLAWCFFSWVLTVPVAGTISGLMMAFVGNSPSLYQE